VPSLGAADVHFLSPTPDRTPGLERQNLANDQMHWETDCIDRGSYTPLEQPSNRVLHCNALPAARPSPVKVAPQVTVDSQPDGSAMSFALDIALEVLHDPAISSASRFAAFGSRLDLMLRCTDVAYAHVLRYTCNCTRQVQ
jgi:hypothetical protein